VTDAGKDLFVPQFGDPAAFGVVAVKQSGC
jgi:hypothetical protein